MKPPENRDDAFFGHCQKELESAHMQRDALTADLYRLDRLISGLRGALDGVGSFDSNQQPQQSTPIVTAEGSVRYG